MGSYISLSGLSAAQKDLNVTSNNLANAATYGFKESRAEFGDVYSNSIFTHGKTANGGGVQVQAVAQQFHEGTSIYTNNPMDLRIQGGGYFAVSNDVLQSADYNLTRNGAFKLDKDNNIVNSNGQYLLGYQVDEDTGSVASYEAKSLKVPDQFGEPKMSTTLELGMNLPANAVSPSKVPGEAATNFNYKDPNTYNHSTSATIYDSLGQELKMSTYYIKNQPAVPPATAPAENSWSVFYTINDGTGEVPLDVDPAKADVLAGSNEFSDPTLATYDPTNPGYDATVDPSSASFDDSKVHSGHSLVFSTGGTIQTIGGKVPTAADISTENFGAGGAGLSMNGADGSQTINVAFDAPTQYAAPFEVRTFNTDGMTSGYLAKVDIDEKGNILGSYSNGVDKNLGRVALVRVKSDSGLANNGNTQWNVTQASGDAMWGEATQGAYGEITSGTLEQSNIDMTQELVDLITAQRNFQANSRALEVDNQLQQTVLNIR